jgi:hypothetical protein
MHALSTYRRRLLIGALGSAVACLLLTATAAAAAPPAESGLTPPVASDCSVDVTAPFNTWLATVPDGSVIALKSQGCYRSNGTIKFTNRHNITIQGNGATIKASGPAACRPGGTMNAAGYCVVPRDPSNHCPAGTRIAWYDGISCVQLYNRAQLWFDRGSNFVVRNLTLQGSNFSADCAQPGGHSCYDSLREADANTFVFGTNGALFDHVNFKNAWGDAVELAPGGTWGASGNGAVITQNITVQYSTVNTTGRHAFTCTDCRNFVVSNNNITNVGYWVTDVEVEAPTWHGEVTLAANTYSHIYFGLLAVTPNVAPSTLGPIVVSDNIATDIPPTCQLSLSINQAGGPQPESVRVTGNTFRSRFGVFINALHADVDNNTLNLMPQPCGPPGLPGITLSNVTGGSIIHNTVIGATPYYKLDASTAVWVCGNRTTASGPYNQPTAVC